MNPANNEGRSLSEPPKTESEKGEARLFLVSCTTAKSSEETNGLFFNFVSQCFTCPKQ
jgi:hypothetical protein